MKKLPDDRGRRNFIRTALTFSSGFAGLTVIPQTGFALPRSADNEINIIGPKEGYSPQIGTLVSMMNWMRGVVLRSVKDLSREQLDYLHDPGANTIGAMLMHLAATEVYYRANTFEGRRNFNAGESRQWSAAMNLGERGRQIKGHDLRYYLDTLEETRSITLSEFRKRDDKWLMEIDPEFFGGQPTNNYCKWFHVCEHESNHNGQIKWIRSRIPGMKGGDG